MAVATRRNGWKRRSTDDAAALVRIASSRLMPSVFAEMTAWRNHCLPLYACVRPIAWSRVQPVLRL
jgi:hypothetical protein